MKVIGQLERAQLENTTIPALVGPTSTGRLIADITAPTAALPKMWDGTAWRNFMLGLLIPTTFTSFLTAGSFTYNLAYAFSTVSCNATVGATYTNNGVTYTVAATVSSSLFVVMRGSGAPLVSGTLTKTGGTGDSTITFTSYIIPVKLRVQLAGSGGGGAGTTLNTATNGSASSFGGSLLTANGGGLGGSVGQISVPGGGGTSSIGTGAYGRNWTGGSGAGGSTSATTGVVLVGGCGGGNAFGPGGVGGSSTSGALAPTGAPGGGGGGCVSQSASTSGGGGGAGGSLDAIIPNNSSAWASTFAVVIGAIGSGGTGTASGGPGIVGACYVEECWT